MHVSDMRLGIIGANGIVAAGVPIALGSALAHSVRESGGVAVAFFGDGAMAEGVLHETLNIASLWKLPLLLVCEANGWSEFSPTSRQFAAQLHSLAAAFHIPYSHVDGADVESVAGTAQRLVAEVRGGGGPQILECATHRVRGHYEGDPQTYRSADELSSAAQADPIRNARELLRLLGLEQQVLEDLDAEILAVVNDSVNRARLDPPPDFDPSCADVYARPADADRGVAA
jgi:pyruvate dehydrogenase E1 component alpha subunit